MLWAFYSLAAGFALITVLSLIVSAAISRFAPGWDKRVAPAAVFVQLGSALLTAAAGGYLTTIVAHGNPLVNVLVLAIITLALGALNALQSRGERPIWLALALVAISPLGVFLGCILRLRVLGLL